jgi:hypothetical protein
LGISLLHALSGALAMFCSSVEFAFVELALGASTGQRGLAVCTSAGLHVRQRDAPCSAATRAEGPDTDL